MYRLNVTTTTSTSTTTTTTTTRLGYLSFPKAKDLTHSLGCSTQTVEFIMASHRTCDGFGIVGKLAKSNHRGPFGLFALFIRMDWFGIRLDHFLSMGTTLNFPFNNTNQATMPILIENTPGTRSPLIFPHRKPRAPGAPPQHTHRRPNRHARDIQCILILNCWNPRIFTAGWNEEYLWLWLLPAVHFITATLYRATVFWQLMRAAESKPGV